MSFLFDGKGGKAGGLKDGDGPFVSFDADF